MWSVTVVTDQPVGTALTHQVGWTVDRQDPPLSLTPHLSRHLVYYSSILVRVIDEHDMTNVGSCRYINIFLVKM